MLSAPDLTWEMPRCFLLALFLPGFVMKLVALLLPETASSERAGIFWLTRSLADFLGRRLNLWFSDWFRDTILTRLRRRPVVALILIFAVSGVMHEWVINVPLCFLTGTTLVGSMMVYFLLQAVGILLERRFLKGHDCLKTGFAWLIILGPAPFIMNEGLLRTLHPWPK